MTDPFINTGRSRALSLVEVMIGMALLGFVMGASLLAIPQIRALSYQSDHMRTAYILLNSELEELRTQTFQQLSTNVLDDASGTSTEHHLVNNVSYSITRKLEHLDGIDSVIESTVDVQWQSLKGVRSISGRAIFSENGLSDKKFSAAN